MLGPKRRGPNILIWSDPEAPEHTSLFGDRSARIYTVAGGGRRTFDGDERVSVATGVLEGSDDESSPEDTVLARLVVVPVKSPTLCCCCLTLLVLLCAMLHMGSKQRGNRQRMHRLLCKQGMNPSYFETFAQWLCKLSWAGHHRPLRKQGKCRD
jgi:hypothetical protein